MINFHYTQVRTHNKLGNFFFLDSKVCQNLPFLKGIGRIGRMMK